MKKLNALAALAAFALLAACATDGDGRAVYGNPEAPGKVIDCQPGTTCH